ncbi:major facilitator superfamily domain-containing protein [Hypoxylon trugodes]|uniref:major facilitator superfamily domain-containing protein n=1 Tax=Hypoxylon trugodes TaxID=326681 RepID=UPI00218F8459|nr:major facilitator superfamily domain-containing protein [Hypoxylon trugodes]KAI1385664.1 major facilitator superfamily domain-containing protein [Hypoxylon trugodes]
MAPNIGNPPHGFLMPPGTVRLISENGEFEKTEILLQPTPTDDPNDPLNWTIIRKAMNFIPILAHMVVMFTQFCIPFVFWTLWLRDFQCTYTQLNTSAAFMHTGAALGGIFLIPMAIKYGRRPVYIGSLTVMTAMVVWQACMKRVTELYITSLIVGLAGSTNETLAQMSIADLFFVHQRSTANGLFLAMIMIGSYLTPIPAGYMANNGNWRQCFWILFGFEAALWIYFILFYEESKYIPRIEAQASIIRTSADDLASKSSSNDEKHIASHSESSDTETARVNPSIPPLTWRQRLRFITKTDDDLIKTAYIPVVVVFRFPVIMYTALQYGFCLCWVALISSTVSIVYTHPPYNFTTSGIATMNLGPFVGAILGSLYGGLLSDRSILWLARRNYGYYEPEMRLQLVHLPAICISGGLLMFGLTTSKGMHWIYPSIGGTLFGFGFVGICDLALTVLIDSYRTVTGEAFVGVALIRSCLGIAIYFANGPWMSAQNLQGRFIVICAASLVIACLHIPFIIWGKKMREKTAPLYNKMSDTKGTSRM